MSSSLSLVGPHLIRHAQLSQWLLQTTDVKEDYILVIDADMIMRQPFVPEEVGESLGASRLHAPLCLIIAIVRAMLCSECPDAEQMLCPPLVNTTLSAFLANYCNIVNVCSAQPRPASAGLAGLGLPEYNLVQRLQQDRINAQSKIIGAPCSQS